MALPRKVATVPGYELLGSPGPALAGHERTFFVRLPADARAGSQVKCSTPTGAPVFFRAPPGAGPGQTVYIPWYAPGEATAVKRSRAAAVPPVSRPRRRRRCPSRSSRRRRRPATAAPHVASVKIKAPAPHVTSVKIKAPAPHGLREDQGGAAAARPRVSFGAAGLLGAAAARSKRRQEAARQQRREAEQAEALARQASEAAAPPEPPSCSSARACWAPRRRRRPPSPRLRASKSPFRRGRFPAHSSLSLPDGREIVITTPPGSKPGDPASASTCRPRRLPSRRRRRPPRGPSEPRPRPRARRR